MKICEIEGCMKPSRRNEMCVMHSTRVYRYNDPFHVQAESHGLSKSKLYTVWCNMIARCENKKNNHYERYGGRGIKVCIEWRGSFTKFKEDMGDIPFEGATMDRKDNNKGYSKENCRWVTNQENCNNRYYDRDGAFYNKNIDRYTSEIRYDGVRIYLGCYKTKEEATKAYKEAAIELGRGP